MSMKKPVIANQEILEHRDVIEQSGGGLLVRFDPGSFAGAMVRLLKDRKKAMDMGEKGCEWVLKNRSYGEMAETVEKIYYKALDSYRGK
jgi:glycosyltransferase involved in cell wall biosynthesis